MAMWSGGRDRMRYSQSDAETARNRMAMWSGGVVIRKHWTAQPSRSRTEPGADSDETVLIGNLSV